MWLSMEKLFLKWRDFKIVVTLKGVLFAQVLISANWVRFLLMVKDLMGLWFGVSEVFGCYGYVFHVDFSVVVYVVVWVVEGVSGF